MGKKDLAPRAGLSGQGQSDPFSTPLYRESPSLDGGSEEAAGVGDFLLSSPPTYSFLSSLWPGVQLVRSPCDPNCRWGCRGMGWGARPNWAPEALLGALSPWAPAPLPQPLSWSSLHHPPRAVHPVSAPTCQAQVSPKSFQNRPDTPRGPTTPAAQATQPEADHPGGAHSAHPSSLQPTHPAHRCQETVTCHTPAVGSPSPRSSFCGLCLRNKPTKTPF